MTRFISPDTPAMVVAREDTRSPMLPKASDERQSRTPKPTSDPRIGTSNIRAPKPRSTPTSNSDEINLERKIEAKKVPFDIGVVLSHFSSLVRRIDTTGNPKPQMLLVITLTPRRPGIK